MEDNGKKPAVGYTIHPSRDGHLRWPQREEAAPRQAKQGKVVGWNLLVIIGACDLAAKALVNMGCNRAGIADA